MPQGTKVQSEHGLNYMLSDSVYNTVTTAAQTHPEIWTRIDAMIENAEALPDFCGYVAFVVLYCASGLAWYYCILLSLAARLLGCVLSHVVFVFKLFLLSILLHLYHNILMRFFLPVIAVLVLTIVKGEWYAGVIFVALSFVFNFVYTMVDNYNRRMSFNDRVAIAIIYNT